MRAWDIDAGFLNDKSLLGEHRELHGMMSIIKHNKKGYSRHPETLRWKDFPAGLSCRHDLLREEMLLRGFKHHSPALFAVDIPVSPALPEVEGERPAGFMKEETRLWPPVYIDEPGGQYKILETKYRGKEQGRIPLPKNSQELWSRHKYSVMARDYNAYKQIGRAVARKQIGFRELAAELVDYLRIAPGFGAFENALLHMWGYVSRYSDLNPSRNGFDELFREIRKQSFAFKVTYLIHSTALGELAFWGKKLAVFKD